MVRPPCPVTELGVPVWTVWIGLPGSVLQTGGVPSRGGGGKTQGGEEQVPIGETRACWSEKPIKGHHSPAITIGEFV